MTKIENSTFDMDEEMRAVDRENFMKFLVNLVDYCLETLNLSWEKPEDQGLHDRILFNTEIGDSVLRYRNGYDELFRSSLMTGDPLIDVRSYVTDFMDNHFSRSMALQSSIKLFVFCAFLVDLAVYLCRNRRPELVREAVDEAAAVHELYLMTPEFTYWKNFKTTVRNMAQYFHSDGQGPNTSQGKRQHDKLKRIFNEVSLGIVNRIVKNHLHDDDDDE